MGTARLAPLLLAAASLLGGLSACGASQGTRPEPEPPPPQSPEPVPAPPALGPACPPLPPIPAIGPERLVGSGTPESCTSKALEAALVAGGLVRFRCGPLPHTITSSAEFVVAGDITVDGGGLLTLSGGGRHRVFRVANRSSLTVQNLTIRDGYATSSPEEKGGGAVSVGYRGRLAVVGSRLTNNRSRNGADYDGGGAISTKSESTVVVESSTFTGNEAGLGGAIYALYTDLTIRHSRFSQNRSVGTGSEGGGGAIYADGANPSGARRLSVCGSHFEGNAAPDKGGALFTFLYPGDAATVEESVVTGNRVLGLGGGVRHGGGRLTLKNVTVSGNTASGQGGGLWSGDGAITEVVGGAFTGNRALAANGGGGYGGGLVNFRGRLTLRGATVTGNHADGTGGGLFGEATLEDTLLQGNTPNNRSP